MEIKHGYAARDSHLRFVFSERVVSFPISTCATLREIAQALDGLPTDRYGDLLAIDVTFKPKHARRAVKP
jgi:hypothetical protein